VEVFFGQWQKLALARGFMRDDPLLLVLDEPTAALDAETEHALFERYAASTRPSSDGGNGRITVLVSHIALLAKGGQYAELYNIQASAYS
jgi:ATP-binding cassette subfamily B protein